MITNKEELKYYISQDNLQYKGCMPTLKDWILKNEKWYITKYKKHLRHFEYYLNKKKNPIEYILFFYHFVRYKRIGFLMNYKISPNTIGPGLSIYHKGAYLGVHPNCRIGRNCVLREGVVFGQRNISENPHITVGDNCVFGLGVKVFGDVKIGNDVIIGAYSVITKDIPDNVVVAGIPAKVIRENNLKI